MVNSRLAFFSGSPRLFQFLNYETKLRLRNSFVTARRTEPLKKQECKTCEIWLKFCQTRIFERPFATPTLFIVRRKKLKNCFFSFKYPQILCAFLSLFIDVFYFQPFILKSFSLATGKTKLNGWTTGNNLNSDLDINQMRPHLQRLISIEILPRPMTNHNHLGSQSRKISSRRCLYYSSVIHFWPS